jgi:branched-chain amino acid transport system permease protein
VRSVGQIEAPIAPAGRTLQSIGAAVLAGLLVLPLIAGSESYTTVLTIDILVGVLFAVSLHFIVGPGGMHSFGHAAYFGLGAYGAGLLFKNAGVPMELALIVAPLGRWPWRTSLRLVLRAAVRRLPRDADARFRADRLVDRLPMGRAHRRQQRHYRRVAAPWLATKAAYFYLTLALCVAGVLLVRRILFAPFGYAMRAVRDSSLRADAIGIGAVRVQWTAFVIAGAICGIAGGLFAFSKGSISPETISIGRSVDGSSWFCSVASVRLSARSSAASHF